MRYLKLVMQGLLALLFVGAGVNHFLHADFYANIIPPYLPWHFALVYISGVFEVLLGVLLLVPKVTPLAAWGLIALLIAMFPANIHMALHPELYPNSAASSCGSGCRFRGCRSPGRTGSRAKRTGHGP